MAGRFYTIGRFKNAPIKLHWTFALAMFVVLLTYNQYFWINRVVGALCLILPYLLITLVHELGHAYVAHKRGLEVISLEIYPVHGRCSFQMPDYEMDHILVAWGGVTAQAILLLAAWAGTLLLPLLPGEVTLYAESVLMILIEVNIISIVFNLLPFEGLDGKIAWRILRMLPSLFAMLKRHGRVPLSRPAAKVKPQKISKAKAQEIADEAIRKIMNKDRVE